MIRVEVARLNVRMSAESWEFWEYSTVDLHPEAFKTPTIVRERNQTVSFKALGGRLRMHKGKAARLRVDDLFSVCLLNVVCCEWRCRAVSLKLACAA